jgi:DNA-binding FadR family transcriptional regulator
MRLLEITHNQWRDLRVTDLRKVMKLNRKSSLLRSDRVFESLREHRAIMQTLKACDAQATVHNMWTHFANGLQAANPVTSYNT